MEIAEGFAGMFKKNFKKNVKMLKNINAANIMKKNMNGDASTIMNGVAAIASGDPTAIMSAMIGDPDSK